MPLLTIENLNARVCGDCGFIELYAEKPGAVWDDHLARTTER